LINDEIHRYQLRLIKDEIHGYQLRLINDEIHFTKKYINDGLLIKFLINNQELIFNYTI